MKFVVAAFVLSTLLSQVDGQSWNCGGPGTISWTGSTTVAPVTNNTGIRYKTKCASVSFAGAATGSTAGFRGACADGATGTDIGNLSRELRATEATPIADTDNQFQCKNTARVIIRVPVAIDGLTIIVKKNGRAWNECINLRLGAGMSAPELRWAYSNLTTLEATKADVKNNDGNAATKLWSELDARCPAVPIIAVGPSNIYGTHDFFKEILFTGGSTEGFRSGFLTYADNSNAMRDKVFNTEFSMGFLGYSYYDNNDASLQAVPVEGVLPSAASLIAGTYQLFTRRIYSMYWKDDTALAKTHCFNTFTFTEIGKREVEGVFFLPIPEEEWPGLRDRVPPSPGTAPCEVIGVTRSPTPRPTRKPVCNCFFLFRALGLCCT